MRADSGVNVARVEDLVLRNENGGGLGDLLLLGDSQSTRHVVAIAAVSRILLAPTLENLGGGEIDLDLRLT